MNLDIAFILGAGLGTRMGPVGRELPKLLWPVFEKSLLELQVDYARECGVQKIYLNTHFQAEKIAEHINLDGIDVEVLHEEELLDIGGAIHNLAKLKNYKGKVLILNGDQFLMLPKKNIEEFEVISNKYVATLMGLRVSSGSSYNELVVKDNELKSIEAPCEKRDYYTYSGVSIINLSMLDKREGKSKFFESVADFKNKSVYVYHPDDYEYWDFGTTKRYIYSMREVLTKEESEFRKFLCRNNAIISKKIEQSNCYNSKGEEFSINLSSVEGNLGFGNIVIQGKDSDCNGAVVILDDLISRA